MQSLILIILENPLASLIDNSRAISATIFSQVKIAAHRNHSSTEHTHRLQAGGLAHSQVLIKEITSHSIHKHVNSCGILLIRGEA
jgi:hypothetical protein